jgi:hypothetical protein
MKRLIAILPVLALAAACGTSGGGGATTTVTRTVTTTVTASAPAATAATDTDPSVPANSDATSSAVAAAAPDACSLLTQAEAEQIAAAKLMKPVAAGELSSGAHVMCEWTGPSSGPIAQVEVYVGDGAQQQLHIDRDNLKHKFTMLPGIGDQCLQEDGFIFVHKNGLWASMHLVRLNDPKIQAANLRTGIKELTARLP